MGAGAKNKREATHMGAGAIVMGALKAVGNWVSANPNVALGAVDMVTKIQEDKKRTNFEEQLQVADEKINQLGVAVLELEEKIDSEVGQLRNELETIRKQIQVVKKMLCIMGVAVGVAIVSMVVLAIL